MNHSNKRSQSLWWHLRPIMYRSTPLRHGDFRLKTMLSSYYFGSNEHLVGPLTNLDVCHVPRVPLIHTNHSNQKLQPLWWHWRPWTCRWTPLRHGDFRLKKNLSSDGFGPIEHLSGPPFTYLDFGPGIWTCFVAVWKITVFSYKTVTVSNSFVSNCPRKCCNHM